MYVLDRYNTQASTTLTVRGGDRDSGTAVYRGVPLKKVLKKACGGVLPECQHLEFIGADTYFKSVSRCAVCR